jgi:hypothetical protein
MAEAGRCGAQGPQEEALDVGDGSGSFICVCGDLCGSFVADPPSMTHVDRLEVM